MSEPVVAPVRIYISASGTFTAVSGTTKMLPADPNRLALLINCLASSSGTIARIGGASSAAFPIYMNSGSVYEITWAKHGPLVQGEVWMSVSFTSIDIGWATTRYQ